MQDGTLLIVSNSRDKTVDFALGAIKRQRIRYHRLNTDDFPETSRVVIDPSTSRLVLAGRKLDLETVTTVWWRRPEPRVIAMRDPELARWAAEETRAALDGAWRTLTSARWVNHPDNNRRGQDKIGMMRRAAQLGLRVPAWIVTNDATQAHEFAAAQEEGIVVKAMVAGRIDPGRSLWTTLITDLSMLKGIGPEPYLLQRLIVKRHDVRVTLIGDHVFAVKIDASADPLGQIDWRRGDVSRLRYTAIELPEDVGGMCLTLMRELGLHFAAIDLVVDESGYWFLEINPNGQWAWVEKATGLPLAVHLAGLLDA